MKSLRIGSRLAAEDIRTYVAKSTRRTIRKIVEIAVRDIDLAAVFGDPNGAAAFEAEHLLEVPKFKSRADLYRHALEEVTIPDGLHLEFGVYKGASINRLAGLRPGVRFHGFDSFRGLPEAWNAGALKGAFSVRGRLPPVRDNVELVPGFYDATLPPFAAANAGRRIAFMHVDCDLYSSTKCVLGNLRELIAAGTVIVFDEFFNFPNWRNSGECKAFMDFVRDQRLGYEFIGYIRHGVQMAVRMTEPV